MAADDVRAELAEALRQHAVTVGSFVPAGREADYRPGAPCMDCGEYPGRRHQASNCPRVIAEALLPVVERIARQAEARGAEKALREAADAYRAGDALGDGERFLRARAEAAGGGEQRG